jgi:diguanylate cyclase (GGDEF)-like protein
VAPASSSVAAPQGAVAAGRVTPPWGASFVLVLALAMAAALAAITFLDYAFTSQELQRQLITNLSDTTASQARVVAVASRNGPGSTPALHDETGEAAALATIRQTGGVQAVAVVALTAGTSPVARGGSARSRAPLPTGYEPSAARQAVTTGLPLVRTGAGRLLSYAAVDGSRVLVVARDGDLLGRQLASLRRRTLPIFLLGLPLGLLICYLAGGRRLARMHRQALEGSVRDGLTGLGNRRGFREATSAATLDALRTGLPFSLVLLDVDRFEQVNDELGRALGDELLVDLARILSSPRGPGVAFRLGGDEFGLLLRGDDAITASAVVDVLRAALAARHPGITVSCGVACVDLERPDSGDLIDRADAALYAAKRAGRDRVVRFDEVSSAGAQALQDQENLLELIASSALTAAFQPIWNLADGRVIAFEALARPMPGTGYTSPATMFAAAERAGLVRELDELCLAAAFEAATELPEGARLFVNLNPTTMADPDFDPVALAGRATRAGLGPHRVTIELTENGVVPWKELQPRLELVRTLGFGLALDDVGSGDTGLQVLRYVDVDYVKVDRSIVCDAICDRQARAVLSAVLSYAAETDCYVIAEGIETDEILSFVRTLRPRIDHSQVQGVQGYLLGRPGPGFEVSLDAEALAGGLPAPDIQAADIQAADIQASRSQP